MPRNPLDVRLWFLLALVLATPSARVANAQTPDVRSYTPAGRTHAERVGSITAPTPSQSVPRRPAWYFDIGLAVDALFPRTGDVLLDEALSASPFGLGLRFESGASLSASGRVLWLLGATGTLRINSTADEGIAPSSSFRSRGRLFLNTGVGIVLMRDVGVVRLDVVGGGTYLSSLPSALSPTFGGGLDYRMNGDRGLSLNARCHYAVFTQVVVCSAALSFMWDRSARVYGHALAAENERYASELRAYQHAVNEALDGSDDDSDGVLHRDDSCPDEVGPAENRGCRWPDLDSDGLPDREDRCAATAGPRENGGCPWPDTDGDGIRDLDDRCPSELGPHENEGCPWPDADGDGIRDADDACVNRAEDHDGDRDDDGCPESDRDGDGIDDERDACPDGREDLDSFADGDGCPDPDNDGDGVLDANDSCVDWAGVAANRGCPWPDADNDGFPDHLDNCPRQGGPHAGCPNRQLVRLTETSIELLDRVHFSSGSTTIHQRSFQLLNDIAAVMLAHPEIVRLLVIGHADSRGDVERNNQLSNNRAVAVARYLESRGVAHARIQPRYAGERVPAEFGETAEAHAANRRVEFLIVRR